ncbi:response regulator transcription factor [uncultured Thiodictyon sp.]|uniref:response regulator transcription factor n=1 Tax=uncultured Thiodictyon sp. TaxID=1846217 RepID=UPI0025EAEF9B|nr:response regulator transcription factor [uncultured Thiodictyon sp.]
MNEFPRIIIVEDDVPLAQSLRRLLIGDGCDVALAFSGAELRRLLDRGDADLVLLDLNLGVEDGMDIARELGETRSVGLIIVTGRGGKSDCVSGLEAGADDYVTKPFDHQELCARIRAVLRRRDRGRDGLTVLALGPYRLNTAQRCLSREGRSRGLELTARESSLLAYLMARPAESVHRSELTLNESWSPDDRATDVHMSHIRRKLQDAGMAELRIQPVRGIGYRLSLVLPGQAAPDDGEY